MACHRRNITIFECDLIGAIKHLNSAVTQNNQWVGSHCKWNISKSWDLCQLKQIMQLGKNDQLDEMGRVFAETGKGEEGGGGYEERGVSERGVRERRREGRISLGGKVSGPVGVSSRVQPLWLGKEGEEGGEAGTGLGQQQYGVCVD